MLVDVKKLEKSIETCREVASRKVDLTCILEDLGISARDLYYDSEAKFILENIKTYIDGVDGERICNILDNNNKLKIDLIYEIVNFTSNYESPVEHETFISHALNIIRIYTKNY